MKRCIAILLLLLALRPVSAQVVVEVALDQDHFLAGEALPVSVKIRNRSGQTLRLGRGEDWLTFSVESRDGLVVTKSGDAPVAGEFTLESSQVATKRVDLAPFFMLTRPGRYNLVATVRIAEWNRLETSPPKDFDIIEAARLWSQEFGVPARGGSSNQPPEVRRYTLLQANYLRSQLRLYFRLTDAAESQVLKVFPIGPLVSFSQPEQQVDRDSNLHVLYQNGAHTFSYTVINPDGDIIVRQTYDLVGSRPRLRAGKDGALGVSGGVRRVTSRDVPPPKNEDETRPSKP